MNDYMETLETETGWDEQPEYTATVSGNMAPSPENDAVGDPRFDEIIEALNNTQNYGTMGDYYDMTLGCYVFPNYEVYEYFIDIDAVGHEWTETSDGHYVPLLYLEAYEESRPGDTDEEDPEASAESQAAEMEADTLETLESVRGLLSVIKENNTAYYEAAAEYQTEMLEIEQKTLAAEKGTLYAGITSCVLLAVLAGSFISHVFFGRMRAG